MNHTAQTAQRNPTLYELTGEFLRVMTDLEERDVPEAVVQDTLEGLSGELERKLENVIGYSEHLQYMAELIKLRENQLKRRRVLIEQRVAWLRNYAKSTMLATDIKRIATADFEARVRVNPEHVVVTDEAALPADCWRVQTVREVDKVLIRDRLRDGEAVSGAHLDQSWRLEIK